MIKSKRKVKIIIPSLKSNDEFSSAQAIVPVIFGDEPVIKIYDFSNDGSYWYPKIGFVTKITEE